MAIMMEEQADPDATKILWSCIARNDTVLVEAGDEPFGGAVRRVAKTILNKRPTPGWEYATLERAGWFGTSFTKSSTGLATPKLKAIKFHVYEHHSEDWESTTTSSSSDSGSSSSSSEEPGEPTVWVFAAVYNPEATSWEDSSSSMSIVKNFIQKIIELTALPRLMDPEWRMGPAMACQDSFSSVLLQRMDEVTYMGKLAQIQQSVQETTNLMKENIQVLLDNEERLREMEEQTGKLQGMASSFQKNTEGLRRQMMLNNAKHGAMVGSLITGVVAAAVVPALVVAL